jgi:transcriptional regulator with XRE-family HTH domain
MEALAEYMIKTGHSYRDMAELLGCDVSMVHRLRKGNRKPGIRLARKLAKVTAIPLYKIRPDVWPQKGPQ